MNWIQPFTVHLIGADRDDLAYLRDVEEGSVFASAATILVLNEADAYEVGPLGAQPASLGAACDSPRRAARVE